MGLIKEPKLVDLIIKSEPWTEKELMEFREIMKAQKAKRNRLPLKTVKGKNKQHA